MAIHSSMLAQPSQPLEQEGRPAMARLFITFEQHPIASATALSVAFMLVSASAGLAAKALAPGLQPDFIALCVMTVVVGALLTGLGWWRVAGFNRPAHWRGYALLVLPAVVAMVLPLLKGFAPLELGMAAYLAIGYLLTGFMEEAFSRGIIMRVLRPGGTTRAIFFSSLLFGLLHLGNVLYRNPFIVLAQAVGACCFGVAIGALRVRTNTIWFVLLLHAIHDFFLHLTWFPVIPLNVVQDVILLGYGLYLIRGIRATERAKIRRVERE
jgi:membrane protease YdiL (CAAX protease family)